MERYQTVFPTGLGVGISTASRLPLRIQPAFSIDAYRRMRSPANSDDPPCSSKTKFFHIEFPDLHVSREDSAKPWHDQLESQLFEAEYLVDEDSVFVPADVAAIVHPSQKETLWYVYSGNLRGSLTELGW